MKTTALILAAIATLSAASCATSGSSSASVKPYPNNTCIVSGNELGSMGPVITKVHNGQEIKFCCKPCVAKFEKNPDRFLAEL